MLPELEHICTKIINHRNAIATLESKIKEIQSNCKHTNVTSEVSIDYDRREYRCRREDCGMVWWEDYWSHRIKLRKLEVTNGTKD